MLFNSLTYLLFFCAVFAMYYGFPRRFQWLVLFVSSLVFYMVWSVRLTLLLVLATLSSYFLSLLIEKATAPKKRKALLAACIVINFGILFVFKYMVLINQTVMGIWGEGYPFSNFNIILPLGISFYTFQAVGYSIDVYRGRVQAEKNYAKYNLFITFFPQLVAGPIERAQSLLPQLSARHPFSYQNGIAGLRMMIMGYFMKMVIADRASVAVSTVFNAPHYYSSAYFWIAIVLFSFQIYCDFCGYSLIAIGSAKMLGIDLVQNFRSPYFAKSMKEFWRRWHISLSGWFKDYVYVPLGGNRCSKARANWNIFVTFLLSGIWHGANWTFLIWGALHGLYQIIGNIKNTLLPKRWPHLLLNPLRMLFTFALVSFAWIFFRANSIADAFYIATHLFTDIQAAHLYQIVCGMGLSIVEVLVLACSIVLLIASEAVGRWKRIPVVSFSYYVCLTIAIFSLGVFTSGSEFIYFQF